MKKRINILPLCMLLLLFVSCEKELMDYEGQDGLYFDVQYGKDWGNENTWGHQIYTHVSFTKVDGVETEVRMKVCVAGSVTDYDRPFKIEIVKDSTNAIAGEEYDALSEEQVIKAGENKTYITFVAKKSERMMTDTVKIQLRLQPNEYFTLPFSDIGNVPGRWKDVMETLYSQNIDPSIHNVFINNMLMKPAGWTDASWYFGKFSAKKYQMLLDVTGYTIAQFEDTAIMQAGRRDIIKRKGSAYLMEQYKLGREHWVLDEDGSMIYIGGVSWAEGTRPEEMIDN